MKTITPVSLGRKFHMRLIICIALFTGLSIPVFSHPPAFIYIQDCWWTDQVDRDLDAYISYGKLWIDVNASSGDYVVYAKIYGRTTSGSPYFPYHTTDPFVIHGSNPGDAVMTEFGLPNPGIPHGIYDIKVEIIDESNDLLLFAFTSQNDGDLNDRKLETPEEDPPATVTVLSPNGGESLMQGDNYLITWAYNFYGNVSIELYQNDNFFQTIVGNTSCDGSHLWTIPADLPQGYNYTVRVASLLNPAVADTSDGNFSIGFSSVVVVTPNGGEIWQRNTSVVITWTDQITENVKIELYKGGNFYSTISSSTPSDGSFTYNVPNSLPLGTDFQIRIRSTTNPASFDISDNYFTIYAGTITITSPNGGEQWLPGSQHTITWTDNIPGYVLIRLFQAGVNIKTLTSSTPSDGSFNWTIPSNLSPGDDYQIYIAAVAGGASDFSDTTFAVGNFNAITVTSPNGGEQWIAGTAHTITWNYLISSYVKIQLYKAGTLLSTLSSSTPCDGSFNWSIPSSFQLGSDYKIKISSVSNPAIFDFSDTTFIVAGGQLTVLSPNGGETLVMNTSYKIQWADMIAEYVKLQLYVNGAPVKTISSSTPSDGSYNWTVNGVNPGSEYTLRITSVSNPAVFDESDLPFSISWGSIHIIYPNGGESLTRGGRYNILWEDNFPGNVKIEALKGTQLISIASSTPSDGLYQWNLPTTLDTGTDYRIKIRHVSDPNTYDYCDTTFAVVKPYLEITYPEGGEDLWCTSFQILWSTNMTGTFNIKLQEVLPNSTTLLANVYTAESDTGSYEFIVPPGMGSDHVRVIMTSMHYSVVVDYSGFFRLHYASGGKSGVAAAAASFVNPAWGQLLLKLPEISGEARFMLVDLSGKMVREEVWNNISGGEKIITLAGIPQGVYILAIRNKESWIMREKLVITGP